MSKMLNLKNTEEKRNSDHSDNEDDNEFHRALFYKKQAEVDVTMFNRKLHRRKFMKKNDDSEPTKGRFRDSSYLIFLWL